MKIRSTKAFTLVEMVVALSLLALLASGSLLLLTGTFKKASNDATLASFVNSHDWATRHSSATEIPLVIDFASQSWKVGDIQYRIKSQSLQCLVLDGALLDSGVVKIPYIDGQSPSYALRFISSSNRQSKWVVVCGPTGLTEVIVDRAETQSQIANWLARWAHAH